ncbi:hypothetical protein [Streptomyces chartreusis]|uniref:hypothetical protein n=1 Tax=Streptomyces chartreusis TaxID=1969 RepID=UPI0036CECDA3
MARIWAARLAKGRCREASEYEPGDPRRPLAAESTSLREIPDAALVDAAVVALTEGQAPIA